MTPRWLYHAVSVTENVGDPYRPASLAREGFIHCSFSDRVVESLALYFPADADVVVLQIDPRGLADRVEVVETPRGPMPHVQGPLPRSAVSRTLSRADLATLTDAI